ncbi:MAG TPA: YceI family protein [Candidatus Binatia bacterium]|nr:YceI family protein [Candidatus Binatia bacterium]
MRARFGPILLLACALAGAAPAPRAIDAWRSSAQFSVSHVWVERVKGTVPILSGSVELAPGSEIPTSAAAVLDATRIKTDEPDRDRALESPDFFDVKNFPTWTFASTKIVPKNETAFEMDGDLTIHGVTQPEVLNVTVGGTPEHPEYRATAEIDRHAFKMSVTRLDPTIGDTVDIALDIVLR